MLIKIIQNKSKSTFDFLLTYVDLLIKITNKKNTITLAHTQAQTRARAHTSIFKSLLF